VVRDAIGMMYIDPEVTGPCRIEMFYDGGFEMRAARAISLITLLLLAAASIYDVWSKRSRLASHLQEDGRERSAGDRNVQPPFRCSSLGAKGEKRIRRWMRSGLCIRFAVTRPGGRRRPCSLSRFD
jgi:hypothetical protein